MNQDARRSSGTFIAVLVAVVVLASFLLFWRLGSRPLTNWDEGIYAELTREISHSHDWWTMTYHEKYFAEKPPLVFWLMAAGYKLFGQTEFTMRMWSAAAGVVLAGLITWWSWLAHRRSLLVLLSGILFVTGRFMFFHSYRTGDTDAMLVLFTTLALFSYWRTRVNQRWWLLFGLFTGLAVMTKSIVGFLPPVIAVLDLAVSRKWKSLSWIKVGWALLIGLIVILPWHIVEIIRYGHAFWQQYVTVNLVERSQDIVAGKNFPWHWYITTVIRQHYFPYALFLPLALYLGIKRAWRDPLGIDRLLVIWFFTVLIIFSSAKTKFDQYIQPLYPAAAMLLAMTFMDILKNNISKLDRALFLLSIGGLIFSLPPRLIHQGILWRLTPYAWLPESWATTMSGKLLVSVIVLAVVMGGGYVISRMVRWNFTQIIVAGLVPYLILSTLAWQYSYIKHLPTKNVFKDAGAYLEKIHPAALDVIGIPHLHEPAGYYYLKNVPGLEVRELPAGSPPDTNFVLTTKKLLAQEAPTPGSTVWAEGELVLLKTGL